MLNIYKTTNDLKLFDISEKDNINKLLSISFDDKTIIHNGKTFYSILRIIFTQGGYISTNDLVPYQIKNNIIRRSVYLYDIIFSNWLCDNGFDGYTSLEINNITGVFPVEQMICKPLNNLIIIDSIFMKPTKSINKLKKIADDIEKQVNSDDS